MFSKKKKLRSEEIELLELNIRLTEALVELEKVKVSKKAETTTNLTKANNSISNSEKRYRIIYIVYTVIVFFIITAYAINWWLANYSWLEPTSDLINNIITFLNLLANLVLFLRLK